MNKIPSLMLLLLFFLVTTKTNGQAKPKRPSSQIEIMPFKKWDSYPEFSYAINSINTNTVRIDGASWGIIASYKHPVKHNFYLKGGLGYYQYSFDKIHGNNRYGNIKARSINYPSPLYILFQTNKYCYNTVIANIGIEKIIPLRNDFSLSGGFTASNYFSYSQYYRITHDYPTGPPNNKYMRYENRNVGSDFSLQLGFSKQIGRLQVSPIFMAPIYTTWALDDAFPKDAISSEDPNSNKSKWFGGYGMGLRIGYLLTKTK